VSLEGAALASGTKSAGLLASTSAGSSKAGLLVPPQAVTSANKGASIRKRALEVSRMNRFNLISLNQCSNKLDDQVSDSPQQFTEQRLLENSAGQMTICNLRRTPT
jgi:hypothetical protein